MKTLKHFLASFLFALSVAVAPAQTVTNAGAVSPPAGSGGTSDVNVKQINGTTTSTTVGIVDSAYLVVSPAATGTSNGTYVFNFGERGKPLKLSGTAQGLAVNLNSVSVTGGNFVITYEWREEP